MNPTPKGIKTTEFWLTLGAATSTTVLAVTEQIPGMLGVIVTSVLVCVYTIMRAALKAKGL